jgi:chromosome segregation ATPase
MARVSKVQESDVFNAANKLRENGFNPTVRAIRDLIGGSTEIVSQYLKEWRNQYPAIEEGTEVDPVTASIAVLYDRLVDQATEVLNEKISEHDEVLEEAALLLEAEKFVLEAADTKIDTLKNELKKQALMIDSLHGELDEAKRDITNAQTEKRALMVEVAHYKEKAEELTWSLKQEQDRTKELERKLKLQSEEQVQRLSEMMEMVKRIQDQTVSTGTSRFKPEE